MTWLDFREFGFEREKVENLIWEKAGLIFNKGYSFGKNGDGFYRVNTACPRYLLAEAMERLREAFKI